MTDVASRWKTHHRRTFIKAAGAAALTLPFIRQRASAAPGNYPVRLIICSALNGMVPAGRPERWECTGNGSSLTLSPMLQALAPVKNKVVAFKGIDNKAANPRRDTGHDPCIETLLRGYNQTSQGAPASPSVDQFIAGQLKASPLSQLGLSIRGSAKSPFWTANGGRLPVEGTPQNVYDRVFRDFVAGGSGNNDAELMRRLRNRRSVMDFVRGQTQTLKGELCGGEKEMLDAHIETIQQAEAALSNVPPQTATCAKPSIAGGINVGDQSQTPAIADAQIKMVTAAVACQITPVVSFSMLGDYQQEKYPFVAGADPSRDYHSYAHSGDVDMYQKIAEWWIGQFATLVKALDAIPEGSGTVLDNCVLVFISDMRVGGAHDIQDIPMLTVGSGGGQIATNRLLTYNGESMNNFLTSLCNVMGVNVSKFGNPGICSGPLAGFVS